MQRRHFLRNTGLSAAILALSPRDLLAAMYNQPAFKITMLRKDAGIFTEKGGTILFHASKKGLIVVDSQFPEQSGHLITELKKIQDKPVDLLINTHHHGDHTGGNIAFKGIAEKVVGHENCLANYKRVTEEKKDADKQLMQDTTFTDTWTAKVAGEKVKAHYFGAGHTNGDAMIHFENANVVHMGDLMFNRAYPFIDRKAGASFQSWVNVLDKARKTFSDKDTIFVFGHGANNAITGTADDLAGLQNFIDKLLTTVKDAIKAGKTKDEILAIPEIQGVGEWKDDFKRVKVNLEVAYAELTS